MRGLILKVTNKHIIIIIFKDLAPIAAIPYISHKPFTYTQNSHLLHTEYSFVFYSSLDKYISQAVHTHKTHIFYTLSTHLSFTAALINIHPRPSIYTILRSFTHRVLICLFRVVLSYTSHAFHTHTTLKCLLHTDYSLVLNDF